MYSLFISSTESAAHAKGCNSQAAVPAMVGVHDEGLPLKD